MFFAFDIMKHCRELMLPKYGCDVALKIASHEKYLVDACNTIYTDRNCVMGAVITRKTRKRFRFPVGSDHLAMIKSLDGNFDVLAYYPAPPLVVVEGMFQEVPKSILSIDKLVFVARRNAVGYMFGDLPKYTYHGDVDPLSGFRSWSCSKDARSCRVYGFLETFLREDRAKISHELAIAMLRHTVEKRCISLRRLCEDTGASLEDGYYLLAIGLFGFSISKGDITNPDDLIVVCLPTPRVYEESLEFLERNIFDLPF